MKAKFIILCFIGIALISCELIRNFIHKKPKSEVLSTPRSEKEKEQLMTKVEIDKNSKEININLDSIGKNREKLVELINNVHINNTYFTRELAILYDSIKNNPESEKIGQLNELTNLENRQHENYTQIKLVENDITTLLNSLGTVYQKKSLDSIAQFELEKFRSHYPRKKNLKNDDLVLIANRVVLNWSNYVKNKLSLLLSANQKLTILLMKERTIAIDIKELEVNLSLRKYLAIINNRSYFNTGADTLTDQEKLILTHDLNAFFDTLFARIPEIIAIDIDPNKKYKMTLHVSVDGFADSQPYRGRTESENAELIQALSQRRADYISALVLDLYKQRSKNIILEHIIFTEPTSISTGNGLQIPYLENNSENDGKDDPQRRITKLQFAFDLTPL